MMKRLFANLTVIVSAVLLLMAGCDRHIESKDPVRSLPDRPGKPVNLSARIQDRAVVLSWEMVDSSGVVRFRIYVAEEEDEEFTLFDSTSVYSQTVIGLPFNEPIRLQVRAVGNYDFEGEPSRAVTVTVGLLSIAIDDNDEYTNSRDVTVQLYAPGDPAYVMLSEDSLFGSGEVNSPFQSQRSFRLSQGDGLKTVYARFIFEDGSESEGIVRDNIILDTYAAIDSVYYSPIYQVFSPGDTIVFIVDASGEVGGEAIVTLSSAGEIPLHDDGTRGDVIADDGVYSTAYVVPVGLNVSGGIVFGDFTDAAGNVAVQATAAQSLDITARPMLVQFTLVEALSSFEIQLRWSEFGGDDFFEYRVYRDEVATVSDSSLLVAGIDQKSVTEYLDTTLDENTKYYYRVYVMNNAGLRSGSDVDSAMTTVNEPPEGVAVAVTLSDSSTAHLTWTRNHDSDFESYRIYRDTSAGISLADDLVAILTDQGTLSYDDFLPFPTESTVYYYRVFVFDRQGLSASSENEVEVGR